MSVIIFDDTHLAQFGGLPVLVGTGLLRRFDRVAFDWQSGHLLLSFTPENHTSE